MKVVLFCGGMGTRLREHSDTLPKSLVPIGVRPIVWHIMRYYAHYGHRDFILCLGYLGTMIRDYFLNYNECDSNDFVLSDGGRKVEPLTTDIDDWCITFVDTGLNSNLGQRLLRVRHLLESEEEFMVNYSDAVSDLPLDQHLAEFRAHPDRVGHFMAARPSGSFHTVEGDEQGLVTRFGELEGEGLWLNAGFFCFRPAIFDVLNEGEEMVEEPFQRLIEKQQLGVHYHDGFWQPMDTFKDKKALDKMEADGNCPWMVWK